MNIERRDIERKDMVSEVGSKRGSCLRNNLSEKKPWKSEIYR